MADEAEKQVLYQPKKMYNTMLKQQYHDTAASYFDDLCAKSGVSKEENAALVKQYNHAAGIAKRAREAYNKLKTAKILLIVFAIISLVVAFMVSSLESLTSILPMSVGLCLAQALSFPPFSLSSIS